MKTQQLDKLRVSAMDLVFIHCDKCNEENQKFGVTEDEAAKLFHNDGWRVVRGKTLCGKCVTKHVRLPDS